MGLSSLLFPLECCLSFLPYFLPSFLSNLLSSFPTCLSFLPSLFRPSKGFNLSPPGILWTLLEHSRTLYLSFSRSISQMLFVTCKNAFDLDLDLSLTEGWGKGCRINDIPNYIYTWINSRSRILKSFCCWNKFWLSLSFQFSLLPLMRWVSCESLLFTSF